MPRNVLQLTRVPTAASIIYATSQALSPSRPSIAFKRQIVQEYPSGEVGLSALTNRHELRRQAMVELNDSEARNALACTTAQSNCSTPDLSRDDHTSLSRHLIHRLWVRSAPRRNRIT